METSERKKLGKKTRAAGKAFEVKVRKYLLDEGWFVCRWDNNVEHVIKYTKDNLIKRADGRIEWICEHGIGHTIQTPKSMGAAGFVHGCDGCCKDIHKMHLVQSKNKYNFFTKAYMATGGFPDFVCFRSCFDILKNNKEVKDYFEIKLVECKTNNKLDKIEKEKCEWIEKTLHINCFVAYPEKEGRKTIVKLRRWNA